MTKKLSYTHLALVVSIPYALFSAVYNTFLPLYVDEAYYWLWSRHLALGYLDHPPMVAYAIRLFTLFGDSVWQIRLVNIFSFFGAAFFVFKSAEYLFDTKSAFYAFLIFIFSPAVTMGLTITTPDSLLVFFWAASFYFATRAFFGNKTLDFALAGALGGGALASKYTGILLFLSYGLFIVFKRPKLLADFRVYLALICGLLVFSPVIIWNVQNGFESFAFQYRHGTASDETPINFDFDVEFLGGMFAVFGPVFFGVLLYLFTKKEFYKDDKLFFVLLPALFTLLFFLYKGLYKKMELNWAAPAFISASLVVATFVAKNNMKKLLVVGLVLSLFIGFVARFPSAFGLSGALNPHERLFGYEEAANRIKQLGGDDVFADHLTLAAVLSYYLRKDVYIPTATRKSEFDRWQRGVDFASKSGIYVSKDERLGELKGIWRNVELIEEFKARKDGFRDKTFYIYKVSN